MEREQHYEDGNSVYRNLDKCVTNLEDIKTHLAKSDQAIRKAFLEPYFDHFQFRVKFGCMHRVKLGDEPHMDLYRQLDPHEWAAILHDRVLEAKGIVQGSIANPEGKDTDLLFGLHEAIWNLERPFFYTKDAAAIKKRNNKEDEQGKSEASTPTLPNTIASLARSVTDQLKQIKSQIQRHPDQEDLFREESYQQNFALELKRFTTLATAVHTRSSKHSLNTILHPQYRHAAICNLALVLRDLHEMTLEAREAFERLKGGARADCTLAPIINATGKMEIVEDWIEEIDMHLGLDQDMVGCSIRELLPLACEVKLDPE